MAMVEINWNPTRGELRQFGLLCLAIFGAMAAYGYFSGGSPLAMRILAAAAAVGGTLGLVAPQVLRPIFVGWMIAAFPIGWTISHLLLGIIFFGVLTPIGLLLRVLGHDPMYRSFDRSAETYWNPHEQAEVKRYFHQF